MTQPKKRNGILDACVAKPQILNDLITYAADSVVSKTLVDKDPGTVTLFAFDAGQRLSEHTAPYDALVQIIDGQAVVTIDGKEMTVSAGQVVIMPAHRPHAVRGEQKFKMLLTMIRA
jgi:quercetin dioxygenase-like cupin family protein